MSYETLNFGIADNIATITLNRPDNANALNAKMAEELHKVSIICDTNDDIRCVVMTATGKLFCGGGDLAEMDAAGDDQEAHLLEMATLLHAGVIRLSKMDAPLIVAVNGTAGGGKVLDDAKRQLYAILATAPEEPSSDEDAVSDG